MTANLLVFQRATKTVQDHFKPRAGNGWIDSAFQRCKFYADQTDLGHSMAAFLGGPQNEDTKVAHEKVGTNFFA